MTYIPLTIGETSSGIGALGVDGGALLVQLVTFLIAYFVLRHFAFGPILKVLAERRKTIESGVQLGEDMKKEKAELEAKIDKQLQEARSKADGIIADAQDNARQAIQEAEVKARSKADGIIEAAEGRIEQDTARARQQLQKELVGLVADATEAIIDEKVDAKKDAQLIERALKGRQTA